MGLHSGKGFDGGALRKRGAPFVHRVEPVPGEPGRFYVSSRSEKLERAYIVDISQVEETNAGKIVGTCPCKGWQVRKICSHLDAAREYREDPAAYERKREAADAETTSTARAVRRKR